MGGETSKPAAKGASKQELSREATKKYTGKKDDTQLAQEILKLIKREDILDYFDEGDPLGEGAFGKVWIGEDLESGEKVAVKTLFSSGEDAQLGREIKVMLEAKHPNLVKMRGVYQLPGESLHLVMDLVEPYEGLNQSDLFEWIMTNGALNTEQICKLMYQTSSALKYLNDSENCIHRDLKPENILIGPELFERVRITDYGLARIFPEGMGANEDKACTANVGSDGYQAPETMNEFGDLTMYGPQCDMFSLGVITYISAAAVPPFGLGSSARREDIKIGRFKPMTGPKWAAVAPEIKGLIAEMLKPDPADRITAERVINNDFVKRNAGIPTSPAAMEAALQADLARKAKMF